MKRQLDWQIIPALPGYSVVLPVYDKVPTIDFDPIIAWMIAYDGEDPTGTPLALVYPVTLEGTRDEVLIRKPDGSYEDPHVRSFTADERAEVIAYAHMNTDERLEAERRLLAKENSTSTPPH